MSLNANLPPRPEFDSIRKCLLGGALIKLNMLVKSTVSLLNQHRKEKILINVVAKVLKFPNGMIFFFFFLLSSV